MFLYCFDHNSHLQTSQSPLMVLKRSPSWRPQMASWICSASAPSSSHSNTPPLSQLEPGEDLLGGPVFAFVQTDLRNNIAVGYPFPATFFPLHRFFFLTLYIQGVRARYKANESTSETLENLVRAEAREGGTLQGTACLVRLARCAQPPHVFRFANKSNEKKNCCFSEAFCLRAVRCRMRRMTAARSFGFASREHMTSYFVTTTRLLFAPLCR